MKKKSSIRFFVVRDFQFLRWKPIKSPDTWRYLQLIDPSQTYQILKHYYQYLPHTSNPNQIPRRYQRKLPTNLSLWTATSWRGSICCTAVTQTKSRDMSVRDLRRLDPKLCRRCPIVHPKRERGLQMCFDVLEHKLTAHRTGAFLESLHSCNMCFQRNFCALQLYFGFWRVAKVWRVWASPNAPLLQKKSNNNNTCYAGS